MKQSRNPQLALLKKSPLSYGGTLLNTRKGRSHGRPIDTKRTMHLVLRSSLAKGKWSFKTPQNSRKIQKIIEKFSLKYGVKVFSLANVGNHLHLHVKITNRIAYKAFIRAITSAIAMAVTGINRWTKAEIFKNSRNLKGRNHSKFWDYRPFTRVIMGFKATLRLKDYILINEFEGVGYSREIARVLINRHGSSWAKQFLHARI